MFAVILATCCDHNLLPPVRGVTITYTLVWLLARAKVGVSQNRSGTASYFVKELCHTVLCLTALADVAGEAVSVVRAADAAGHRALALAASRSVDGIRPVRHSGVHSVGTRVLITTMCTLQRQRQPYRQKQPQRRASKRRLTRAYTNTCKQTRTTDAYLHANSLLSSNRNTSTTPP